MDAASPWTYVMGSMDFAVQRIRCWGIAGADGCRLVWRDGTSFVEGAGNFGVSMAQGSASAAYSAVVTSEGWVIYNLFRRQLAIFVANGTQTRIEADFFVQRSFWLRNLTMSPAAFSVLIPLAPPGLNFTSFFISDVRVSWTADRVRNPIVIEIQSVEGEAAEVPCGTDGEIENMIQDWLKINGGVQAVPFQGTYPLLDGATFRMRHVRLNIASPTRYGNLSVRLQDVELKAVDESGRQRDLKSLVQDGLDEAASPENSWMTFSRLVSAGEASVRYLGWRPRPAELELAAAAVEENAALAALLAAGARGAGGSSGPAGDEEFLLAPTAVELLMTQRKASQDMRLMLSQRWSLSLPGPLSVLTLPPFLTDATALPPADPRLCPFPAPALEWRVHVAKSDPFWMMQPAASVCTGVGRPALLFAGVVVLVLLAFSPRPRPWIRTLCGLKPFLLRLCGLGG